MKKRKKNRISDGPFNEIELARLHTSAQLSDFQVLKLEELIKCPELKKKKKIKITV